MLLFLTVIFKYFTSFSRRMKRRVVQQGPATLMISLPSKWVKENNIAKGNEVELTEEKGKLIITLDGPTEQPQKKEVDTATMGIFNEYFVNYFYQKGYDEVLIRSSDASLLDVIEKRAKQMIGFEVVQKTKNTITLKMLVKIDQQEFDIVLRKLFQITLVMGDKIIEAVGKKDAVLLAEVAMDEKENNKYTDLCLRILSKNKYKYPENGFMLFALLRELEQTGDLYKWIADDVKKISKIQPSYIDLFKKIHAFFRLYYELYYSFDGQKAQSFFSQKNELLSLTDSLLQTAQKEETVLLSHCQALIHAVFNLKGPMFLQQI